MGSSITNSRYTYLHDCKRPCEAVDVHHIIVRKSGAKGLILYLFAFVILATAFYVFFVKVCLVSFYIVLLFISLFSKSSLRTYELEFSLARDFQLPFSVAGFCLVCLETCS